ncbi:MAG: zinc ribbon domain-containing protein, partial [Candidatus Riflebacteria bacterium]|nr:zinc ribbon domain-containing protein [Candidatus Riflebacteria bacterium]
MPIYEFECCDCHKTFDKLCSIKEDLTQITCCNCNSKNIRKKMSAFSTSGNRTSLE